MQFLFYICIFNTSYQLLYLTLHVSWLFEHYLGSSVGVPIKTFMLW